MQFLISYFSRLRYFKPNMIPFNTAMWPPKFYDIRNPSIDKNGVLIGVDCPPLKPGNIDASCGKECSQKYSPNMCSFQSQYYEKLQSISFQNLINHVEQISLRAKNDLGFEDEPIPVLMVYESNKNFCGERLPLIKWFADNGVELKEFEP